MRPVTGWNRTLSGWSEMPRTLKLGVGILVGFVAVGLLAPFLPLQPPNEQNLVVALQPPSAQNWLGTDALGRDTFSRLLHAIRIDLPVVFLAGIIPAIIGTVVGSVAAFSHRWVDLVVMRIADAVQAFPVYVLLLVLVFTMGQGPKAFIIGSTLVTWVAYARLVRGEVLRVRSLDFVRAAQVAGLPSARVLVRHVLPNTIGRSIVYFMSDLVLLVLALASLSYLGAGIPAPDAEWGRMIVENQAYLRTQWWLVVAPGAMIMALGVGLSMTGDGLDEWIRRR